ncbi:MAG: alpha-glucuronidase, partial [Lachnospiraceae bacterium]|nr:alpha-glucuronidase [Lachnospiraceae bacterium]
MKELRTGLKAMLGIEPGIVFGSATAPVSIKCGKDMQDTEEYTVSIREDGLSINSKSGAGILYGVFDILRSIACGKDVSTVYSSGKTVRPSNPLRMLNHWDNMSGDIERGYSGNSFFFENDDIVINERTEDYARLIASVGINGVVINNVNVKNAASYLITDRFFDKVAKLGEIFAGYGIRLFLSLNYASTIEIGGLDSADPL